MWKAMKRSEKRWRGGVRAAFEIRISMIHNVVEEKLCEDRNRWRGFVGLHYWQGTGSTCCVVRQGLEVVLRKMFRSLGVWVGVAVVLCGVAMGLPDCKAKMSCSECREARHCMWCTKPGNLVHENGKRMSRCFGHDERNALQWRDACGIENTHMDAQYFELISDMELSDRPNDLFKEVVQLRPQKVFLKLDTQEPFELRVGFRQVTDMPMDVFFLVDFMEDNKEAVTFQGQQLAERIHSVTSDIHLGFGSFVANSKLPDALRNPNTLQEPCPGCDTPYNFRNARLLTSSMFLNDFLGTSNVPGRPDVPVVGLEALIQAIVCEEQVNWREEARHVVIFATASAPHVALGGQIEDLTNPDYSQCRLDSQGDYYKTSTVQDGPTASQIGRAVKAHKVNVIFAVTEEQEAAYFQLSRMIQGSHVVRLSTDSPTVLESITEVHAKITTKVELQDNAKEPVRINYFSNCQGTSEKPTSACSGLRTGDQVEFRLVISVDECPVESEARRQTINVNPIGLRDNLAIDLEVTCSCSCDQPGDPGYVPRAEACNSRGTLQCGVCHCEPGFIGSTCDIRLDQMLADNSGDNRYCYRNRSEPACSGRGTCVSGMCHCHERDNTQEIVNGKFCECTNFLCSRFSGLLCGGPDHGQCVCNFCKCMPGWIGEACMCEDSVDNCINPYDGKICSDNGKCECNQCKCYQGYTSYSGKYCEDCPHCKSKCLSYKECVMCQVFGTGTFSVEDCKAHCTLFNATLVDTLEEQQGERQCVFFDENDCRFKYLYGYGTEPYVRVQRHLECPPSSGGIVLVLVVVGSIVAVGAVVGLLTGVYLVIRNRRRQREAGGTQMEPRHETERLQPPQE